MAAAARAITPSHSGPFGNGLDAHASIAASQPAAKTLSPLPASVLRRSGSPRSPKTMSPRISPQPPIRSANSGPDTPAAISGASTDPSAKSARPAASRMSQHNLALVAKSVVLSEDGGDAANAQLASDTAPMLPPTESPQLGGDAAGRSVVDPGLPGVSDSTPGRAYTFPSPLTDEHTPTQRNLSLPNNMFPGSSPRSTSSAGKRHKCPYCQTEFTRHHNLKSHLLTHSQEKPYECQECNSRFRRLHDLKRHAKLHTGERPHECTRCGRKFARGDALARHAKGPGGCAGRRSSFIEEDPSGHGGDESMDGVEYTAEPEHIEDLDGVEDDDLDGDDDVNGVEGSAAKKQRRGSYRPSTYPGVSPGVSPAAVGPLFAAAGIVAPPRQRDMPQFGAGSMAESPKPISPGRQDTAGGRRKGTTHSSAGTGSGPSPLAQTSTTQSSAGAGSSTSPGLHGFGGSGSSARSSDPMAAIASTAAAAAAAADVAASLRDVETRCALLLAEQQRLEAVVRSQASRLQGLETEGGRNVKRIRELEDEVKNLRAARPEQAA